MLFKIKNFLKFPNIHRKTPVLKYLFKEVAGLKSCNFIKKRFQHSCFPVNIAKFLITFFIEHLWCLLLRLINAKRYRKKLSWLYSSVFTVNFEHILQFLQLFSIHCSLWASKRGLRSGYVCFLPSKKSYLSSNKN